MNKIGRVVIVTFAVMVQVMISVLYGFSKVQVPSVVCFLIWCVCAAMICKVTEAPETI